MLSRPLRALRGVLLLALLLTLSAGIVSAEPAAQPDAAGAALDWLRTQQLPDGSFAAFSGAGDAGATADAIFAFTAAGVHPSSVRSSDSLSPVDLLTSDANALTALDAGLAGKVALALHAAGVDPRATGGVDLIAQIEAGQDAATGWYGPSFYGHGFAVLALHAAGATIPQNAVDAILAAQTEEGSWGFTGDPTPGTGDSNTTAITIQALAAIGAGEEAIAAGITYLLSIQAENGAIAYDASAAPDLAGDANSTALAIQAFLAAGEDPSATPGGDLIAALLAFQNPSGAFQYMPDWPDDSLLATTQAIPALQLQPYPIEPVAALDPRREAMQPVDPLDGCDYHVETGHNVCDLFRDYWHANGGLANFGHPLTEAFELDGLRVQYFERARFEWHPDNAGTPYEVLLTLVGVATADLEAPGYRSPVEPEAGCSYFAETGHNACGTLADFWVEQGGLAVFGYPVTEAFVAADGTLVQYFERARFEYREGSWPERNDILLGRLVAEQVARELGQ